MDLYIDKNNLLSFIHTKDPMWKSCNSVLKRKMNVFANFGKTDFEGADKDDFLQWLTTMTDDCPQNITFNCNFPSKENQIKTNCYNDFNKEQLQSVYMLDRKEVEVLNNNKHLMFIKLGDELNCLQRLWFKGSDLQYSNEIMDIIHKWDDLSSFVSPCTDIVIADKFIFSDKDLLHNAIDLVKVLSDNCRVKKNVVVFCSKYTNIGKKENSQFQDSVNEFKIGLKKAFVVSPNVTIVDSGFGGSEHDRIIFTNYLLYSSGDSFNYFNDRGKKITKGRVFNVYSFIDGDYMKKGVRFIEDMQKEINRLSCNSNNIIGDKECHFLNFN